MSSDSKQDVSQALAQIVSGAFVMTVGDTQGSSEAILVSFVQQVGFEPPRIVAAIYKERPIIPALERSQAFVLNVLAAGDQELLRRFVERSEETGKLMAEVGGRPLGPGVVLEPAAAYLVCKVVERVDIGDHWLYIADVGGGAAVKGRAPLVHVRRSGLRY